MPLGQWQVGEILDVFETVETSTRPVRVRTSTGIAMLKLLGNPEGPHALAREWIGTSLAREMGIPTFDFALFAVDEDLAVLVAEATRLPFGAGHAFATRFEEGKAWDGLEGVLSSVENPEDISALVVLDTWLRNRDRCPPRSSARLPNFGNVWLSGAHGPLTLKAIDHTHCLDAGLLRRVGAIAKIKEEAVYGVFEGFIAWLDKGSIRCALDALGRIADDRIREIVQSIPGSWAVTPEDASAIESFLMRRSRFVRGKPSSWFLPSADGA